MLESFTTFVTVVLALSVASERLVELVKGMIAKLNGPSGDADRERWRQFFIHLMSLVASFGVVLLMQDYIRTSLKLTSFGHGEVAAFSILASGGSSMWNTVLTYLLSLKTLKQEQVVASQKVGNADLTKGLPSSMPKV